MITDIIILIIGLAAVTFGANWLTDGASAIAKKFGVTEFMIGMTIVAVGTSLPELVVSITAALNDSSDLSVGNIVGSNICNILLILGLTAIIVPIPLTKANIRIDIPLTIAISLLFAFLALDSLYIDRCNEISRIDGAIFFVLYILFLLYLIRFSKEDSDTSTVTKDDSIWKAILLIVIGLIALIGGAKLFVKGAIGVAHTIGISDAVIGITVVAIGTSLPELAASLVAAIKGKSSMAIGNVLGSNIANILLIMGSSSLISPLGLTDITVKDFAVMLLAPVIMLVSATFFRSKKITRLEGAIFLAIYITYTITLVI